MSSSTNSLIQIPKNRYRGQVIESASGLYFLGNGVRAYSAKLTILYLDVNGIRLGRYIKEYEENKESIELFFSELGGTVHKVSLYEKTQGVTKTKKFDYTVYGDLKLISP